MIKVLLLGPDALPAADTLLARGGSPLAVVPLGAAEAGTDPELLDPDTFSALALDHGVMLSEIACVDASAATIAVAEVLGIRAHRFVGVEPLRTFLADVTAVTAVTDVTGAAEGVLP